MGTITGPLAGNCGGFNVTNFTTNSGNLGIDTSYLDICDAGNPAGGFDYNTGSWDINVTFCSCSNNCATLSAIPTDVVETDFIRYPNPASQHATLEFDNSRQVNSTLTLYDTQGRLVKAITNITTDKLTVDTDDLTVGLYFFQLRTDRQVRFTGKLTIE